MTYVVDDWEEALDIYENVVSGNKPADFHEKVTEIFQGPRKLRSVVENHKQTYSLVMPQATFVIDDAYDLYKDDPTKFDQFVQVLRDACYGQMNCKVIFLTGELNCLQVFCKECMFVQFETLL